MELLCESKDCAVDDRVKEEIMDGGGYSWKPADKKNNTAFWGLGLEEAFRKKLGTIKPEHPVSGRVSITNPGAWGGG